MQWPAQDTWLWGDETKLQIQIWLQYHEFSTTVENFLPLSTKTCQSRLGSAQEASHLSMSCCRDAAGNGGMLGDGGCASGCPLISTDGHDALQLLFTMNIFHSIPWVPTYCVQSTMLKIMGWQGDKKNPVSTLQGLTEEEAMKYDCVKIPDDRYK